MLDWVGEERFCEQCPWGPIMEPQHHLEKLDMHVAVPLQTSALTVDIKQVIILPFESKTVQQVLVMWCEHPYLSG